MYRTRIEQVVFKFLDDHLDVSKPLLLAFSGGPDSTALLHLLLTYQKKKPFQLHLAHVDHCWRKESTKEAKGLQKKAEELGLFFHLISLDPTLLQGNLEEQCRIQRLAFFSELCLKHGFQAVVLGHHANDQAETVLKRIFEGSGLLYQSGMKSITHFMEMLLWRPLLTILKKEILVWASNCGFNYIEDCTNQDPTFLRGRMRQKLIPHLSSLFKKEIEEPLSRLAAEASEVEDYLELQTRILWENRLEGPFGICFDLQTEIQEKKLHPAEIRHLMRKLARHYSINLSYALLDECCQLLLSQKVSHPILFNDRYLIVDRGRLFVIPSSRLMALPVHREALMEGNLQFSQWTVKVSKICRPINLSSWKNIFMGEVSVGLPIGEYHVGAPILTASYPRSSEVKKWLTNHKVPTFMRMLTPVIWRSEYLVHEFLTGKKFCNETKEGIQVTLQIQERFETE